MDLQERVQPADWVVGIGGLILFISCFLQWYTIAGYGGSGWDATKLTLIIILCAFAAIAIVVLRIVEVDLSVIPVPMGVVTMAIGGLSALIIILRILIKPSYGTIGFKVTASVSYGIFVSLIAAVAVIVGGVLMQREEMY